jgi:hypothetical protein
MMGKLKSFFDLPAVQIFIACLIPNLGSWIMFLIIRDRIDDAENERKEKSFLDPPGWMS